MAEERQKEGIVDPEIEELTFGSRLLGTFDDLANRLSPLELFYTDKKQDSVVLLRVEGMDIQKRPFLFFIITFRSGSVSVQYSIAHDTSVKMRRLNVLKNTLNILSLVADIYTVDNADLFQHIDSAIDDVLASMPQSYSALYNAYEALNNEYKELRRLNIELTASNKNLTVQAMQLSDQNRVLEGRLKELQTYSDEALMARVQDWIEAHDGTIDIDEFSKASGVIPSRVEQILNTMISRGFIEVKG